MYLILSQSAAAVYLKEDCPKDFAWGMGLVHVWCFACDRVLILGQRFLVCLYSNFNLEADFLIIISAVWLPDSVWSKLVPEYLTQDLLVIM